MSANEHGVLVLQHIYCVLITVVSLLRVERVCFIKLWIPVIIQDFIKSGNGINDIV